ncbi:MAG: hypothetical protein AAF850_06215 [Pseudomonadota bacterium]
MNVSFADGVGFIGVGCIVGAYFLLQIDRLKADAPVYSLVNGVGALLILFSLYFSFNLASVVIEVFWLGISGFGLWRALRKPSE